MGDVVVLSYALYSSVSLLVAGIPNGLAHSVL